MLALAILPLVAGMPACAGDIAAGRRKALQCQACHGLDGLSKLPEAPHLAGQPERYLVKSLDEYRTGARKDDMMALIVKNLSDQDIADLAAYYAAIGSGVAANPNGAQMGASEVENGLAAFYASVGAQTNEFDYPTGEGD